MSAPLRVRELAPGESRKPFIDLAWRVNRRDPHWVPPLRMVMEKTLDPKRHPFYEHAEVALFLAERGGEPVGRVAAIHNRAHNEHHGDRVGFFGFFECDDDAEAAAALLEAAGGWLKARGLETMRGPMNLSTNEEAASPGILIDGFDTPPTVAMSHNPPYYQRLLEGAGMERSKDLLAYHFPRPHVPERLARGAEALIRRYKVTIRTLDVKRFQEEVALTQEIYHEGWQQNWGFVPMTAAEFANTAADFRQIVDPALVMFAEIDGRAVGFSIALPDMNQVFRHIPDGRLFPFGIFKFLWYRRKVTNLRLITLGFRQGYQHLGLGAAFYLKTIQNGAARGYTTAEGSWILEDNWEMRRALEKLETRLYKTWRVYERAL